LHLSRQAAMRYSAVARAGVDGAGG
jgi:hypothetical protein